MRLRIAVSVLVALLEVIATKTATAQERFGGLAGIVTDSSQAPVPGATITATNKQTGAARLAVSGADGTYRLPDLEPGWYTVTVELQGFQKVQADDVLVLLGRTADLPARLKVGGVSEVVTVTSNTKTQVDLHSTTVAHNVTAEEFDRMPKARSFQGIALTSPGVNQGDIERGFQVNGASGAENSFTVDGVNTNSLLYGSSRQDTVFEYLQEVQVKTGGIAAEYGGVISAVTKSGGNSFTGEGHYYFSGSAISAGPVQRLQLSPIDDTTLLNVQDDKQGNTRNEVNDRGTRGTVNATMPSLYVQDTWIVGNRLTLNLGVRTERETIPSFRTDVKPVAFEFGLGKKIAPRLGATFDVLGNGHLKAYGSWGRFFDW